MNVSRGALDCAVKIFECQWVRGVRGFGFSDLRLKTTETSAGKNTNLCCKKVHKSFCGRRIIRDHIQRMTEALLPNLISTENNGSQNRFENFVCLEPESLTFQVWWKPLFHWCWAHVEKNGHSTIRCQHFTGTFVIVLEAFVPGRLRLSWLKWRFSTHVKPASGSIDHNWSNNALNLWTESLSFPESELGISVFVQKPVSWWAAQCSQTLKNRELFCKVQGVFTFGAGLSWFNAELMLEVKAQWGVLLSKMKLYYLI